MRSLSILLVSLLLFGCAWEDTQPARTPAPVVIAEPVGEPSRPTRQRVTAVDTATIAASIAQQQVGVPYRYGGQDPRGFDCSGLVHFAYQQAGHNVARTTSTLWASARPVASRDLMPGDVIFFRFDDKPSHVGLYLGDGWFVHAPSTGKQVTTARVDAPFYANRMIRGGRLVE
ncbi:MAG: C40 family peptidase [Pseudomonadota bacterium]